MQAVTELEGKKRFAELMLRHPGDPRQCAHKLAYSVGIYDQKTIASMAEFWPHDPIVQEETKRLIEEKGEDGYLPSKQDVAWALWKIADSPAATDDRLKALKDYANLMGFIQKDGPSLVIVNKVMTLRDHGSDDEWERKAAAQQARIIEHVS